MTAIGRTARADDGDLAERYGRTPSIRRRNRRLYTGLAVLVGIVVVAWVIWAGLDQAGGSIEAQDTSHRIIDDKAVSISFLVSMPVGSTASCALQVQNDAHGIVGWRIVKIPASKLYTTGHTNTVRTAEQAVTGLIYRCWLT
ncbi:DUF4307 domain-containing protein [Lacisediminihabitans sp.]|jgi:hypothetical protein|uniref:DUF4307 domain-containing protein n=1 Tax=Lacisediminihabitans sp. TaxID=2787631 RepID=UPI002F951131